jgi:hypothetical protein
MTEQQIINNSFYLLEKDSDTWATTDSEYLTARGFLNVGVNRWASFENTTWRELWTTNSNALSSLGGDTTVSASVWTYDTPSDFVRPGGYVTTTDSAGGVTFWRVLPNEEVGKHANSTENFAYFTGNKSAGFDLNFNAKSTPTTGGTINYPYYKAATQSSATSTVLECGDPNFLSYFIAAHMSESTDAIDATFFSVAEGLLRQMKSVNNSGIWGTPFNIQDSLEDLDGFGYGGGSVANSGNPTGR